MVNLNHYVIESQPIVSVSGYVSSQMEKRYLKDYPESDKTYVAKYKETRVKDPSGYILCVPDAIKDQLVLEDPSDTKFQRLVRKYSLALPSFQRFSLYKQIAAEFGEKETFAAVIVAFNEKDALFSEETRTKSDKMIETTNLKKKIFKEIDEIKRQWGMDSHTKSDGLRHLKNRKLTVFETFKYGRLMLFDYLEKNYPVILTRLKVILVALPFFLVLAPATLFFAFLLQTDTRKV